MEWEIFVDGEFRNFETNDVINDERRNIVTFCFP